VMSAVAMEGVTNLNATVRVRHKSVRGSSVTAEPVNA